MRHARVDLGSTCKLLSYSAPWVAMDTMQFYVIQTGLFLETISFLHSVVPLNNFASVSNCPWVQVKSNKPPPFPRYVWGGGGGKYLFHDFTSIFRFIDIHEYANEIILYVTIG